MPTFVYMTRCDGCGHCVDICPSDIMHIDKTYRRAYNIEPNMCWECYSCVKICPQNAIEMRAYADIVPLGGVVQPLRGTDSIVWTVKFRNGTLKRFKFPIRKTPEGSAVPDGGFKTSGGLDSLDLFTEPESLGLPEVFRLGGKESANA